MSESFFVGTAFTSLPKCKCGLRFKEIQREASEIKPWARRVLLGCDCGAGKFMYRLPGEKEWSFTEPREEASRV